MNVRTGSKFEQFCSDVVIHVVTYYYSFNKIEFNEGALVLDFYECLYWFEIRTVLFRFKVSKRASKYNLTLPLLFREPLKK